MSYSTLRAPLRNYPPDENFSISMGNKSKIVLPGDSFSKIPSEMDTPIPSQDKFNYVILSGITLPITMGTNYSIPSGNILLISPWGMSNTTEYSYDSTPYKCTPTNSKVHLVDSYSLTSDPSTNPTTPTKLRYSKIRQHIWICIFNEKQDPKNLKRYDVTKNHWRMAK